jgi:tetratricopeptide (TPR) repeat protein
MPPKTFSRIIRNRPGGNRARHIRLWITLGLGVILSGCGGETTKEGGINRQLEAGARFLDSLNFNQAADIYELLYKDLEETDGRWPEAAFGYAVALWNRTPPSPESIGQAEEVFEQVSRAVPGTEWDRAARLNLARIHMLRDYPGDEEDPEAAIPILEALTRENGLLRHEALVRLAECHRMRYDDDESLTAARDQLMSWLEQYPDNPLASLMWEQVGWLELEDLQDREAAVAAFERAAALGFADPSKKGMLLWTLAQLLLEENEPQRAAVYFTRLIEEAPASGRAYEAQVALRKIRETVPGMESLTIPDITLFTEN